MIDMSALSDAELEALAAGDMSRLSDTTLKVLAGEIKKPSSQESSRQYESKGQVRLDTAMNYLGPLIEGGAAGVGGVLGAASPIPGGTVIGGGLGYGIGREITEPLYRLAGRSDGDLLPNVGDLRRDEYSPLINAALNTVGNVQEGLNYELMPSFVFQTGKKVAWDAPKRAYSLLREMGPETIAKREAAQIVGGERQAFDTVSEFDGASSYKQQINEALENLGVDKSNLTLGQRGGNVRQTSLEQQLSTKYPGRLQSGDDIVKSQAQKSVDDIMTGSVDDTTKLLEFTSEKLQKQYDLSKQEADVILSQLSTGKNPQQQGKAIIDALNRAKQGKKNAVSSLFDALPDSPIKAKMMAKEFAKIRKGAELEGRLSDVPSGIMKQIMRVSQKASEVAGKRGEINFQTLRGYRSQLSKLARETSEATERRYINKTIDAIDNSLNGVSGVDDYAHARLQYKDYVDTFGQGEVGTALSSGSRFGGSKVNPESVPSRIFSNANDTDNLIKALGSEDARVMGKEFFDSQIANFNDEAKVAAYINKNKNVLDKLGLTREYESVSNVLGRVRKSQQAIDDFNKSQAGKILGVDPGKELNHILSGGNRLSKMNELVRTIEKSGDDSAINGLQAAYWDTLKNTKNSTTFFKNFNENLGALKVLYKNSPEKLKSIQSYIKVMEALGKNKNVSYSGNSTTAEKQSGKQLLKGAARLIAVIKGVGWGWSSIENMTASIVNTLKGQASRYTVDDVLQASMYDPNLAAELSFIARTGKTPKHFKETTENALNKLSGVESSVFDDVLTGFGLALGTSKLQPQE